MTKQGKISMRKLTVGIMTVLAAGLVGNVSAMDTIDKDTTLQEDTVVTVDSQYPAPGIEAAPQKAVTVDANGKALHLNLADVVVGDAPIHAIEGKANVKVKNLGKTGLQITAKAKDTKFIPHHPNLDNGEVVGIYGDHSDIAIDGDVTMELHGVGSVYAIRTEDKGNVTISGKLTVGEGKLTSLAGNEWNIHKDGKHSPALLSTSIAHRQGINIAKKSKVTIGEVDIHADDKGIVAGKGSAVTIGHGILKTKNNGSVAWNHLFDVNGATIRFGMDENKPDAGDKKVELEGNIKVENDENDKGIIDIGLRGDASYWKGTIDSAKAQGALNLYLRDGAHWENESMAARTTTGQKATSNVVSKLSANRGTYIIQTDTKDTVINEFEGQTTFIYKHNRYGTEPEDFTGGRVIIKSAKEDSHIELLTDTSAVARDKEEEIYTALSILAKKLVYEGYKNKDGEPGERNLMAAVRMAEKLTVTGETFKYYTIKFDENTGEGVLKRTDVGLIDPKTTSKIDAPIMEDNYFGSEVRKAWNKSGVRKTNKVNNVKHVTYTFDKDLILDVATGKKAFVDQVWHGWAFGAIQWSGDSIGSVDMTGHNLKLIASSNTAKTDPAGIFVKSGTVTIQNVNNIDIEAKSPNGQGKGIFVIGMNTSGRWQNGDGQSKLVIDNKGVVKVHVDAWDDMGAVEAWGNTGSAEIDIKGMVDIESQKFRAVEALQKGKISIGGGIIKSSGNAAIGALSGSTINVNATVADGKVKPVSDTRDVQIIGGITSYNKATTNVALATKNSYFHGMPSLNLWGKDYDDGVIKELRGDLNLYMAEGAYWENEEVGTGAYVPQNGKQNATPAAIVSQLISKNGSIIQKDKRTITIDKLDGEVNLYYGHEADGTKSENYKAGATHIKSAESGSKIHLYTDRNGIDTENNDQVKKVLAAVAGKLYYDAYKTGTAERNLTGTVGIAEGLTTAGVTKDLGSLKFKDDNGQALFDETTFKPMEKKPDPKEEPGKKDEDKKDPADQGKKDEGNKNDKETSVVAATKTAVFSTVLTWQAQNNDLQKRLGDLRLSAEDSGLWAKYQGGSSTLDTKDAKNNQVKWDGKYNGIQVGYDKVMGEWTIGGAVSYLTNDDTYLYGTGKGHTVAGAVYGSQVQEDGTYIDIIAKAGQVKNDYDVHTREKLDSVEGTYKANGVLLSFEYGKRMEKANGFYLEPSAELTVSQIGAYDEEVTSDKQTKFAVHTDAVSSMIGKLGLAVGQKTDTMSYYGKLSVAHEFGGEIKGSYTADKKTQETNIKMEDTWLDLEVGGSYKLSETSYFYGTFTKNFGAKLDNKWRLDAGIRFAF